eukprot:CAMPEP_0180425240 /NCGR_PEP_ID=MMETSP1036_2-20121128/5161_1 /TAXON_ID=632150 /ORGANISM="Azadinium spinosum, Strain 3D9" /LENGTH=60 /DNA_ID=CAMNT_0022430723 /DNA_START=8 /DNA_END=190 /DNA_ORIENTATION=+
MRTCHILILHLVIELPHLPALFCDLGCETVNLGGEVRRMYEQRHEEQQNQYDQGARHRHT